MPTIGCGYMSKEVGDQEKEEVQSKTGHSRNKKTVRNIKWARRMPRKSPERSLLWIINEVEKEIVTGKGMSKQTTGTEEMQYIKDEGGEIVTESGKKKSRAHEAIRKIGSDCSPLGDGEWGSVRGCLVPEGDSFRSSSSSSSSPHGVGRVGSVQCWGHSFPSFFPCTTTDAEHGGGLCAVQPAQLSLEAGSCCH